MGTLGGRANRPCASCGGAADPLRDPARIVDGRLVTVCRPCAGGERKQEDGGIQCDCGALVRPGNARPRVIGARVELCCPACAQPLADIGSRPVASAQPEIEPVDAAALVARPRHLVSRTLVPVAAAAVALAGLGAIQMAGGDARPRQAAVAPAARDLMWPPPRPVAEQPPPQPGEEPGRTLLEVWHGDLELMGADEAEAEELPEPEDHELELFDEDDDVDYLLIGDWTHPVVGSEEPLPDRGTRRFGAYRPNSLGRCGEGHCGVDLSGPRGTPIVATYDGVIVRIEQRSDRRSGKYVKIRHPGDVYTSYMHLDDIRPDLRVGTTVRGGYYLGSLGATGIKESAPHLHFEIEVHQGGRVRKIDPAPQLETCRILDLLDLGLPLELIAEPRPDRNHRG